MGMLLGCLILSVLHMSHFSDSHLQQLWLVEILLYFLMARKELDHGTFNMHSGIEFN